MIISFKTIHQNERVSRKVREVAVLVSAVPLTRDTHQPIQSLSCDEHGDQKGIPDSGKKGRSTERVYGGGATAVRGKFF